MRNVTLYTISALCIVLAVAFVTVILKMGNLRSRLDEVQQENSRLQTKVNQLAALGDESEVEQLRAELEIVKPKLAKAEQALAERDAKLSAIQVEQAQTDPESEESKKDSTPPFMRMFESEEALGANAKMQVNMQYGILLADLKLPSDVEDEVRAILADSLKEQLRTAMKAMQDGTMKDFRANQTEEAFADALRAELSTVLNADEMVVWEDYEANKGYYMLEQSYDMQLGMYAPSMSRETRDTVKQVLAEEMTVASQDLMDGGESESNGAFDMQSDAMNRGLERLSTVLNEEEYAQVERFIEQQNESLRATQAMMQSMMGTEGEEEGSQ